MTAPRLHGLHHVKLPVTDLDTSLNWYQRVFDAQYLSQFDDYDGGGYRYAVILWLPGVDIPIALRWAPRAAAATIGYDPVQFVAGHTDDLLAWINTISTGSVSSIHCSSPPSPATYSSSQTPIRPTFTCSPCPKGGSTPSR